jgi:ubiquinone/menaquinone biosynthesis C-methylase UbiE
MDRNGKDTQGSQGLLFRAAGDDERPAAGGLLQTPLDGREPPPAEVEVRTADDAGARYREERVAHWDAVARSLDGRYGIGKGYHRRLERVYQALVPPGRRVIEIGCGEGGLLASLRPSFGVGVDFSAEMLKRATVRHPHLHFVQGDAHELSDLQGEFDAVILSDLLNDAWDVQGVFQQISRLTTRQTRVIINSYSHVWELPLSIAGRLRLTRPNLPQNWLTMDDIVNVLHLTGFAVIRRWQEVLWPVSTPLLGPLCNRVLVRFWPFSHLALTNFVVARFPARRRRGEPEPLVSVVVPARNEAGNIAPLFARMPEMGCGTEVLLVEGGSTDGTYEAIEREIAKFPERRCLVLRQDGQGKGDAMRLGFSRAGGEVLMVLDADLTVPPEDLPRFYRALLEGKGEFINGVRLVYPMEQQAMRFANLFGNKLFSLAFSWLLGQPVKDTLCGTKVLWKADYEAIAANRSYFGDFDPFGDFDLLFGAARLNLEITELPIRYRERTYGTTNIRRWRHGWMLLKMVGFAALRLKFV